MLAAAVNVEFELEEDGFELPIVAMCGEVLNFVAFEATIGSSETTANEQNNIGVTRLLNPQSQQGLVAFPTSRNVLKTNVVVETEYAACIETDSVGSATDDATIQADIEMRKQQKKFYSQTLQNSIAPFYPFLEMDSDSYINKPSCVV